MINVILALAIGTIILYLVFSSMDPERIIDARLEKRLVDIKKKKFLSEDKKELDLANIFIKETEYKIKFLGELLDNIQVTSNIQKKLKLLEVDISIDVFIMIPLLAVIIFLFIAYVIPDFALAAILLGVVTAIFPFINLNFQVQKRFNNFTKQFPDSLDLITSSLRAGHSLQSAFQVVVSEMPKPVSSVFKIAVDEISLGIDVKEALDNMSESMPDSIDLRFFVTAVLIQREIGGNLAEILDKLSSTIRERFKVKGQLKAQTAQAKLSGIILAVVPIFIIIIISLLNPGYLEPLFKDMIGKIILTAAAIMEIIGFLIIQKITNIRI